MVIPLVNPVTLDGHQGPAPMNDFTDNGTTWTLVAHEARPGHELQTSAMLAQGVSIARGLYAFNSANVEGWALYAESLVSPYLPPEGRMMSLWQLLEREARAFLDPELQLGKITPEQALALLKKDLVLSDGMASQEVERYMFRMPGQATAYFYGYEQLRDVRAEAEKAMGARFNQKAFHDFVLGQGMLTLDLIRTAVRDRYIHAPPV